MLKTFTSAEMLAIWRSRLGFDIKRANCSVEQFELLDVDSLIKQRMRLWYLELLDTANPTLLPVEHLTLLTKRVGNSVHAELPDSCRRIVRITVADTPVDIKTGNSNFSRLQCRYMQPHAAISNRTLAVGPCHEPADLQVFSINDPGEESYILDETLLATIPNRL